MTKGSKNKTEYPTIFLSGKPPASKQQFLREDTPDPYEMDSDDDLHPETSAPIDRDMSVYFMAILGGETELSKSQKNPSTPGPFPLVFATAEQAFSELKKKFTNHVITVFELQIPTQEANILSKHTSSPLEIIFYYARDSRTLSQTFILKDQEDIFINGPPEVNLFRP
jgi:hypothetical protein